ncbi:MAG: hypothetical protein WC870_02650 [Candidatus Paceibacterota bacterium]
MQPEEKKLLEQTYELVEENNRMLHSIKRTMFMARIMSVLYWVLIIGVSVGAFYFIQPYLDQLMDTYSGAKSNLDNLGSLLKKLPN